MVFPWFSHKWPIFDSSTGAGDFLAINSTLAEPTRKAELQPEAAAIAPAIASAIGNDGTGGEGS